MMTKTLWNQYVEGKESTMSIRDSCYTLISVSLFIIVRRNKAGMEDGIHESRWGFERKIRRETSKHVSVNEETKKSAGSYERKGKKPSGNFSIRLAIIESSERPICGVLNSTNEYR